jgi:hypothetical protein
MIIHKKNISPRLIKCFLIGCLISKLIFLKIFIIQKSKLISKLYIKYSQSKNDNCFLSPENANKKIIHIIITNFIIDFYKADGFPKIIYTKEYLKNGIRVMKKYLLPSLQYQSCKDFIWMLKVGDKANITYLKSLLNIDIPFKSIIIYNKEYKNFIRNITKNIDILITTRIDYDDRIYWNAVNDVRKVINRTKPLFLYGYNRGFFYFEELDIYTHFFRNYKNNGTMSIFQSLIIFMNKVNDSYTIYDLDSHTTARKYLLNNYKQFGLKKLDYEPAYIDYDSPKFVWVRQNFSGTLKYFNKPKTKAVHFNLDNFYGIKK